jgi:hypothetical protein
MKHTPTPWHHVAGKVCDDKIHALCVAPDGFLTQQQLIDCMHIVHCVNLYDALVAALRATQRHFDEAMSEGVDADAICAIRELVQDALAAAREES